MIKFNPILDKTTRALVVKLVDTKDLKSLPIWEPQFNSDREHLWIKSHD